MPITTSAMVTASEKIDSGVLTCPDHLPVTASARPQDCLGGWLHATLVEAGARGAILRPTTDDAVWQPGRTRTFVVAVPFVGDHEVIGVLGRVGTGPDGIERIGVTWTTPPARFLAALAEYLMLAGTGLSPAELRATGLPLRSASRAVRYDSAHRPQDERDVLSLRLRAHQHQGRLRDKGWADLASPFDAHARHLVCRYGSRIVGYVRVILVEGDPTRSQYVSWGGHEVPPSLWEEGFAESGAGAIDPDFQKAGLFLPLMQHCVRVAIETGCRHLLGACDDDLLGMYRSMGFVLLESRDVEPRPGWRFRSHLIDLDLDRLADGQCRGTSVPTMREAALCVRSSIVRTRRR